ncbi:hypothetical protein [Streptomyces prunicolor]|uniref:hypothetical protein n=1 Tax=Streptomyces prunicolor TaxID=67348 RepID=UPI0033F0366B
MRNTLAGPEAHSNRNADNPGWFWAAGTHQARTTHVDRVGSRTSPRTHEVIMPDHPTAGTAASRALTLTGGAR